MEKLKTRVNNVEFINPFILASAPPTRNGEMIARAFDLGWGGAVTKTICLNYHDMVDVSPRLTKLNGGIQNIELISNRSPEDWAIDIKKLKAKYSQHVVIASISAEANNIDGWQKLTIMMQDAGADILELNLSCPHGLPEKGMGNACSDIPEVAGAIVKAVKEAATIPVWAKLSPNVTDIRFLAEICKKNGADGITAINTVKGYAGVDIDTGLPKFNVGGLSTYGGMSGEMIKPIALRAVSDIAKNIDCPVSGVGGIKKWDDAVEFMLIGASTVQICTKVMLNGYDVINNLRQGLIEYLEKNNFNSIQEIKGSSLKYITSYNDLKKEAAYFPEINQDTCIKCGCCAKSCYDSGHQAINFERGEFPVVNTDKCTGCGLCSISCPEKCISVSQKKQISV